MDIRNIFETQYPRIEEIYIHYINTDEYAKNELIRKADENFYRVIGSSFSSKTDTAIDDVTSAYCCCGLRASRLYNRFCLCFQSDKRG